MVHHHNGQRRSTPSLSVKDLGFDLVKMIGSNNRGLALAGRKFFVGGNWKANGSLSQVKVGRHILSGAMLPNMTLVA